MNERLRSLGIAGALFINEARLLMCNCTVHEGNMDMYLQNCLRVRPCENEVDQQFAQDVAWAVGEGVRVAPLLRQAEGDSFQFHLDSVGLRIHGMTKERPHVRSALIGLFLTAAVDSDLLEGKFAHKNQVLSLFSRAQRELTMSFLSLDEEGRGLLAEAGQEIRHVQWGLRGACAVAILARELSGNGAVFLAVEELDLFYSTDLLFRSNRGDDYCVQVKATQAKSWIISNASEASRSPPWTAEEFRKLSGHVQRLNRLYGCAWRPMYARLALGPKFTTDQVGGLNAVRRLVAA